jgi:hypothetical protein
VRFAGFRTVVLAWMKAMDMIPHTSADPRVARGPIVEEVVT